MKKLFLCLMLLVPVFVFAQVPQPFDVVGKLGNINARVFLGYQLGSNRILDSAEVVNGAFELKGDIMYPSLAIIIVDYKGLGSAKLDAGPTSDKLVFYLD